MAKPKANLENLHQYIKFLDNEEFRPVVGVDNYLISNYGRCFSLHRNVLIKPSLNYFKSNTPYLCYYLMNNAKGKWYKAHRLVAQAFIPNPLSKEEIHHINGDVTDNRVENLMWITKEDHFKEHNKHSRKTA